LWIINRSKTSLLVKRIGISKRNGGHGNRPWLDTNSVTQKTLNW